MTLDGERCSNLYEGRIVSSEGFTQNKTAKCRNQNCLNGGVHPIAL